MVTGVDETRAAWLAWRREGIGASDVAAALGVSPWLSPLGLYLRKVGDVPEDEPNEAMQLGSDLEDFVSDQFTKRTGLHVAGAQTWCIHPEHGFARCTVDGFVVESAASTVADALGVFETKTTGNLRRFMGDDLPLHVELQVQWQMFVTGHEHAWVCAFGGGDRLGLAVREVERDDVALQQIVERVAAFWQRVEQRNPPEPTEYPFNPSDARDLAAAFDEPEPGMSVPLDELKIETDEGERYVLDVLRERKAQASALADDIARLENAVKARMGDAEAATFDGEQVLTWKAVTSRRFDTKRCKAEAPDVFERFAAESTARRFVLRQAKG